MSQEILINATPQETRVAILENGVLQELLIERDNSLGLVGNIYQGKVLRVMPGMDAAFVDIGIDKAAFLHVANVLQTDTEPTNANLDLPTPTKPINELLKVGDELLVQVTKDPLGSKGARLTTQIAIASRFLVLLPNANNIGVSTRIDDQQERERLRELIAAVKPDNAQGDYIVRTVAEGVDATALQRDAKFLQKLRASIAERAAQARPTELVYSDLPLLLRTLRDFVDNSIDRVLIDSEPAYRRSLQFVEKYMPEIGVRIEYYNRERPLFDLHSIEDEIQKALQRKVQLKSGGHLIIDQTEAMTTIDVNTGGFIGHRNLEETIYRTNLEAAQALARQLKLRNLGGIIIIDFIDMEDQEHKRQVIRALQKALDNDYARTQVSAVSELGLVEMSRQRTRESLEHMLCQICPTCSGRGSIRTAETVCYEILRELSRVARSYATKQLTVLASQSVIDLLLDEESGSLADLENSIHGAIRLQVESVYSQEQYDVVMN